MSQNKVLIGIVVVAVLLIGGAFVLFQPASETVDQPSNAGGQRAGVQNFDDGARIGDLAEQTFSAELPAGSNEVQIWHNTTGRDAIVEFAEIIVGSSDTASSSALASVFATTSTSVGTWADFGTLAEGKRAMIQAGPIATSTTATTSNSVLAAKAGLGNGAVLVPNGSYVFGFLQQDTTNASIACAAAGACETATSSNRGFDPLFNIRVHYLPFLR